MSPHAITATTAAPVGSLDRRLRIDLLGPVVVTATGDPVTLSPLELNLLVILALTPGVAVSTERLVDDLWGDHLPAAPRTRVQALVSSLRRKVGDAIQTRYPGYVIEPKRLERDLDECERLVGEAREAGTPAERLHLLAGAQAVWRGDPLDGVTSPGVAPERTRLHEQRLDLLVARGEAELALGRHRELVGLLAPAVAKHPLAEQLAGLYITALYRSNRQADAYAAYQSLRERLADELGADVCPELRELHAQILRGECRSVGDVQRCDRPPDQPAGTLREARPAQLPAPDELFLGREAELRELKSAVAHRFVVVSGPGGLGKTALVVGWAHRAAAAFPDGQLFLDLKGGRRSPKDVVAAALVSLGVAPADVPSGLGNRIALYRTLVHDRRLLVVADDAGTVAQVLAVAPSGPGSRLVVTTRRRPVTLWAHHAVHELVLRPLDAPASRDLLSRVVGSHRLDGQDVGPLVTWCGGWPLLLRQVAATLALRPSQSVAGFVAELAASPQWFGLEGDLRSVDGALAAAYDLLSPEAARLFERLSLVAGEFCLHRAALTAGTSDSRARALLDELVGLHLVVEDTLDGFRYDDVVARFARRLAAAKEWTLAGFDVPPAGCLACPTVPSTPLSAVPALEAALV
jgi:DNA-binding SARP family transcriptional activator